MLKKYIEIPNSLWNNICKTGSNYICSPPTVDTDIDFVIYTTKEKELINFLEKEGFTSTNSEDYEINIDGLFTSLRKDKINLIIVNDWSFYLRWYDATKLAKQLNLKEKKDRITLFSYILYGFN